MAESDPYFHNISSLRTKLSLTDSDIDGLTEKIGQAIMEFRIMCRDVYGSTFFEDVDTTEPKGIVAEFKYVKGELVDLLGQLFVQGSSNSVEQLWNEDGLTRDIADRGKYSDNLKAEARSYIVSLKGNMAISEVGVMTLGTSSECYKDVFQTNGLGDEYQ